MYKMSNIDCSTNSFQIHSLFNKIENKNKMKMKTSSFITFITSRFIYREKNDEGKCVWSVKYIFWFHFNFVSDFEFICTLRYFSFTFLYIFHSFSTTWCLVYNDSVGGICYLYNLFRNNCDKRIPCWDTCVKNSW